MKEPGARSLEEPLQEVLEGREGSHGYRADLRSGSVPRGSGDGRDVCRTPWYLGPREA
jgi:hypothetical protein